MPRCPGCFSQMTRVDEGGIKVCTCPNCFGHWIQRIALLRATRQAALDSADRTPDQITADQREIADLAAVVTESNTTKTLKCTLCNVDMLKDRVHPMIPVTMDRCPKCTGIWLDAGEYSLVKKLTVELQNTTDPELIAKREKLAMAMMQWESRERGVETAQNQANAISDSLNILTRALRNV